MISKEFYAALEDLVSAAGDYLETTAPGADAGEWARSVAWGQVLAAWEESHRVYHDDAQDKSKHD